MPGKRVVMTAQARQDIRLATAWYRQQGGSTLALRWVDAVTAALHHISLHPKTGSTRHAIELKLDGLRHWPVSRFPHLVFYLEGEQQIHVGRVLHGERDIPAWLRAT
ncbi:MAG: type II toxin-antitoxin system RelE/ParE family toxin [Xanthomonadales bacterium]|nr:type II toxin-antitoxin system RelE/ParE family toxin [Xanthomonadales bacterium]